MTTIIYKTYKFYLLFYSYLKLIPKFNRYTIAKQCESKILNILELLIKSNYSKLELRPSLLNEIDIKLKFLKLLIRLMFEIKSIDQKKYIKLEENLQEIGKMLGGWIKKLKLENPDT